MQLDLALFQTASAPEPRVHTVTEVTRRLRELIEHGMGELWVEGEVSNLRRQSSGHQYFTLKDDSCQLQCVLFSGTAATLHGLQLADGERVQVLGLISVYEPRGQYQMIVRLVQARGAGTLQAKFEALKRKLAAEGLFEPARKRRLPRFPRRLGLGHLSDGRGHSRLSQGSSSSPARNRGPHLSCPRAGSRSQFGDCPGNSGVWRSEPKQASAGGCNCGYARRGKY